MPASSDTEFRILAYKFSYEIPQTVQYTDSASFVLDTLWCLVSWVVSDAYLAPWIVGFLGLTPLPRGWEILVHFIEFSSKFLCRLLVLCGP